MVATNGFDEEVCWGLEAKALKRLDLRADLPIFNLDLRGDFLENLRHYYDTCRASTELMVTTSCFATWKQGKFQNGCAKVIPAVPVNGQSDSKARVFFFDDNINLHLGTSAGSSDAKGICNLRELAGGEYIDFSDGKNGFQRDRCFRHTLVCHSSQYRNVLVQVNILDAMSNHDYFTSIISKYSKDGEKLIIYMDVNGTILWDDTIMSLGQEEVLLSTMFGCIEVRPSASSDFVWNNERTVKLEPEKPRTLKQLVHDLADGDKAFYKGFWTPAHCANLLADLRAFGHTRWTSGEVDGQPPLTPQGFSDLYHSYMDEMQRQNVAKGITVSWFRCLEMLRKGGHSPVLQSFGMDTHRVVRSSVPDERRVVHIAVNMELWSDRDKKMFSEQFQPVAAANTVKMMVEKPHTPEPRSKSIWGLFECCRAYPCT
mmetsp:Transcript_26354/g.61468  ORF Transcript_26354/g.61468 Transcript_26354/m.61468 type:complete len:428 (+) Transcript_26354:127-1410(+)